MEATVPLVPELAGMSKDLRLATATLDPRQARYLVDMYYTMQDYRISSNNQARAMLVDEEPHDTLNFFAGQMTTLEKQVHAALAAWTETDDLGLWAKAQVGIGPVLAAGFLAHIDIAKAPTAGHIWRFAGLDPTVSWGKGQKRPWNAKLKVVCWKAGESFVKNSFRDNCLYGHLYLQRKEYEVARNEAVFEVGGQTGIVVQGAPPQSSTGFVVVDGEKTACFEVGDKWFAGGNALGVHKALTTKKIGKTTEAYGHLITGKLPPAQIHARSTRWAVKIFLSHYHEQGYRMMFGKEPPAPFPIAHLGHTHKIEAAA